MLKEYCDENLELKHAIYFREYDEIQRLTKLLKNRKLIIYGAGSYFDKLSYILKEHNLAISDVVYSSDNNIFSKITNSKWIEDKSALILICSTYYNEIYSFLIGKGFLPEQIKIAFQRRESDLLKQEIIKKTVVKHKNLLHLIKQKTKIKVVFLASNKSVWKADSVFKKMQKDDFFDPIILVCPFISFGEEQLKADMEESLSYFSSKGFNVISAYKEGRWVSLDELNPDIVFFNYPHSITRPEYYEQAYLNYLSFYIPYHHEVGSFNNNDLQHNQLFHNVMWKIFSAHEESYQLSKEIMVNKAENITVTGFPAMESLMSMKINRNFSDVWKNKHDRIKIIWAPHHLILEDVNQSNFIEYADFFKDMAIKYQDEITIAFKPHPILKPKLFKHPDWGRKRTEEYYQFWNENDFTQLEIGPYEELFLGSDAMIHDCGSFLAEYLYVEKPVMYLLNDKHNGQFFNDFGKKALNACRIGVNKNEIENFIVSLIDKSIQDITSEHKYFYTNNIKPYFTGQQPSDLIINHIKNSIKNAT